TVMALALTRIYADVHLIGALTILMALNVITPMQALVGFSNEGVATIAALYVVVAGLRETGVVTWISQFVLGLRRSVAIAQLRLMLPVAILSAFVNNTPVVALLIPGVRDWGRRYRIAPSKLLMPLSYAAIIGGTCTLIGTSTNLVISGMMHQYTDVRFGLFDIAWIGVPCVVLVVAYTIFFGRWLLPEQEEDSQDLDDVKQYVIEMLVEDGSSLANKTIEAAGLRHLPGLYLVEINRDNVAIPAVSPQEVLRAGDRLLFAGIVESVADLQRFDGLRLASDHVLKLSTQRSSHTLIELVVSEACPLIGKTVRAGRFRNVYNAAILAVLRHGKHVHEKIGDIVLQAGDMLLVEAHVDFTEHHRNSRDFLLVSQVENSSPPNTAKRPIALVIFLAMIGLATSGIYSLMVAALLAAGAMLLTRCTSAGGARREISWQILIVIGASIGLGNALMVSGAADSLAALMEAVAHQEIYLVLGLVFLITATLTAVITNIAAATLLFPIVVSLAEMTDLSLPALCVTLMVAASASFATPIGYQTNLMVYSPGGYQFTDFVKMGAP
ncbi:MAG: SLC13 family permease, partial [Pseudomonadales bacterium]